MAAKTPMIRSVAWGAAAVQFAVALCVSCWVQQLSATVTRRWASSSGPDATWCSTG